MYIDHADIVVTHKCNMNCPFCIDPLRNTEELVVKLEDIETFLKILKKHTNETEVLLLGGEPTVVGSTYLKEIASLVHRYGFKITMSTNGVKKNHIIGSLDSFDSVQITAHSQKEIDFWAQYGSKVNLKLSGDAGLTYEKLQAFMKYTENKFYRRSVSMYFTPEFYQLCTDAEIWALLNTFDWQQNGSYMYAFHKNVRFKRCIDEQTNIIDEPTVPKLYPNGNYNKTWNNELHDPYLN